MQDRVASELAKWSGGQLKAAVNKQQQKDILDGQMAYQQGRTFEDVEMGGNKWALEGYRLMDAQTLSSSMLAAQRAEIEQGAYELDPDAYRQRFTNRLDALLENTDARTAELVRTQMAEQMPVLVADHTTQHLRYQEQRNYDSLVTSMDVVSRDPTAIEQVIDFATGEEGSPSSGLSTERRQAAVVSGVVAAFDADNPLAFAVLSREGLLGDNLTPEQKNAIRGAQRRYEGRRRDEYNAELMEGQRDIERRINSGKLSPLAAAEEWVALLAEHEITATQAEAGNVYDMAKGVETTENRTASVNFETAIVNGDWRRAADIMAPVLIQIESGGDPTAVSSKGAKGRWQVMDYTNSDPGFGITPARDNSRAERERVGREYWQTMVGGSSAHKILKWEAGDLEAAAIAYNAGPGVANKWIASGRNDSVLPQETKDYKRKMLAGAQHWKAPTAQDRLSLAQQNLQVARERNALAVYEEVAPRLSEVDDEFMAGKISEGAWLERRAHLYERYDYARTKADVDHEISLGRERESALEAQAKKTSDEGYKIALDNAKLELVPIREQYEQDIADPSLTDEQRMAVTQQYRQATQEVFDNHGIQLIDRGRPEQMEQMLQNWRKGEQAHREWTEKQGLIGNANTANTVGTLPKDLQQEALRGFDERTLTALQEVQNEDGDITDADVAAQHNALRTDYIAKNGIVDEQVQQTINVAASGTAWIGADGKPRPHVVAGLHSFMSIYGTDPALASRYVPDPQAHARMLGAAYHLQAQFPDRDVFKTADLTDKSDPLTNAMYDTVEQMGLAMKTPASPEQQQERLNRARDYVNSGNLSGSWFGGVGAGDAAERLLPGSLLAAGLSKEFDAADVNAARQLDNAAITSTFLTHVEHFIDTVGPHMPMTPNQGLAQMAMEHVEGLGAIMGNTFVMPKAGEPSIRAQMFPGKTGISTAAPNTAIVEWMRKVGEDGKHPILAQWYEDNAIGGEFFRAISPFHERHPGNQTAPYFTVQRVNGQYVAMLPGHGSVTLPMKEIGDLYLSTR